ncbi:MAG: ABC transporter permease, partial [Betaproteobacteria bacterium]
GFVPPGFTGQWRSWVIAASTGAGVGIALLGVLAASQRASRVRPLEALLQTGQATRVMTWSRWLLGLVFLGGGIAMLTLVPAVGGDGALAMSILVCFPLVVGLAALAPLVVPLLGGLLGIIGGRSAVGHLARANIRHGVRRTASTAAPIMVLVALVAGLAGTLSTVAEAGRQEAARTLVADFVVTADRPIGTELADVAGVRTVSEEMTVPLDVAWVGKNHPDAPVDALAVDPTAYLRTHHLVPTAGDLRDLHGATVAVRPNDLPDQGWRIGGSLPVLIAGVPTTLRVVALLPTTLTGSSFLVPAGLIPADPKTPRRYAVQVDSGVDLATVGARLAHFGPVVTKAEWIEGIDQDQQRTNLKVMIALLGLASLYTVIAIINAVVISASDRRDEFAVDRMTGLTRAQVVRMALSEAFTVVVAGVMLGGIAAAGTVIGNVIALTKMTGITVLSLPWPLLAWIALSVTGVVGLTSLLTTLAATRPAAHRHPGHGQ